ncbi:MAG: hypothetical protein LBH40_01905 [Alphaproteobacteria bacterium]|jgi:hypothetical protein|nr:hypothetical protein [Alphaproteobacteria bacterium]
MKNLLPENQVATVRKIPVRIGGSDYLPSTDTILLEESLNEIVSTSKFYLDDNINDYKKSLVAYYETGKIKKNIKISFSKLMKNHSKNNNALKEIGNQNGL